MYHKKGYGRFYAPYKSEKQAWAVPAANQVKPNFLSTYTVDGKVIAAAGSVRLTGSRVGVLTEPTPVNELGSYHKEGEAAFRISLDAPTPTVSLQGQPAYLLLGGANDHLVTHVQPQSPQLFAKIGTFAVDSYGFRDEYNMPNWDRFTHVDLCCNVDVPQGYQLELNPDPCCSPCIVSAYPSITASGLQVRIVPNAFSLNPAFPLAKVTVNFTEETFVAQNGQTYYKDGATVTGDSVAHTYSTYGTKKIVVKVYAGESTSEGCGCSHGGCCKEYVLDETLTEQGIEICENSQPVVPPSQLKDWHSSGELAAYGFGDKVMLKGIRLSTVTGGQLPDIDLASPLQLIGGANLQAAAELQQILVDTMVAGGIAPDPSLNVTVSFTQGAQVGDSHGYVVQILGLNTFVTPILFYSYVQQQQPQVIDWLTFSPL